MKVIYDGVVTHLRTMGGETETFSIIVDLYQDGFKPYLFAFIIYETN